MGYYVSTNGIYYKVRNYVTKELAKCELIFITVDVVARDPDNSKEYDRYYVYELKPLEKWKPIYVKLYFSIHYKRCDGYVYKKI